MTSMMILALGVFGSIGLVFAYDALRQEGLDDAIEETANRAVGVLTGSIVGLGAALTIGLEQVPELILGALGVGSIMAGLPWEMLAAGAVLVWLGRETVEYRARRSA